MSRDKPPSHPTGTRRPARPGVKSPRSGPAKLASGRSQAVEKQGAKPGPRAERSERFQARPGERAADRDDDTRSGGKSGPRPGGPARTSGPARAGGKPAFGTGGKAGTRPAAKPAGKPVLRKPPKPAPKKVAVAPVEVVTITKEEAGARLDRWFKRRFDGVTQGEVEKLLRTGQIRVDGARAGASDRLEEGQSVRVPPLMERPPESKKDPVAPVSDADAAYIRSLVIYEDDELIALNKPAGLAVQGGTSTKRHVDGMSAALGDGTYRPRLVHRLDRDTSGVLILAKHPAAAARLGGLFRSRKLTKVYWAIVLGVPNPPMGEIRGWMIKAAGPGSDREMMRTARHGEPDARFSITDYEVVSQAAQRASWVALKPVTGRTHQLRLHMAQIGCAMLGDRKYTCDREEPGGDVGGGLHLHARGIELPRESGPPLQIKADLPPHMLQTFEALGFNPKELGRSAIAPFQTEK